MTKLIKKVYQGQIPKNKIVNAHSNSKLDTYSCDYLNPNILTAYFVGNTPTGNYINFTESEQIGSNIILNGNTITVTGFSKVLISASITIQNATNNINLSQTQVLLNDVPIKYNAMDSIVASNGAQTSPTIPFVLLNVSSGNTIKLKATSDAGANVRKAYITVVGIK